MGRWAGNLLFCLLKLILLVLLLLEYHSIKRVVPDFAEGYKSQSYPQGAAILYLKETGFFLAACAGHCILLWFIKYKLTMDFWCYFASPRHAITEVKTLTLQSTAPKSGHE